jgi:eukaryotic-like serine/threonine-protein kinase
MTEHIGRQFGNYQLTRLLGQGGFADVYLGEHVYLKTQAAIKVLQLRLSGTNLESFLNEARTIAHLEHPNIVAVLDFGVQGTIPFLVMSYAPNGTLRQRYPRGNAPPLSTVVTYVKQVAGALQYAHDQRVIHRDVKPENLLLGRTNDILLSDFSIAQATQSSSHQSTQAFAGTVTYMAPEHIKGKPRPASDQYALGIVAYEWLSGDRPFHGSFMDLCTQQMTASPPPLRTKIPTISPAVEAVVMTALAKDPQKRFNSVWAFANALEQAAKAPGLPFTPVIFPTFSPTEAPTSTPAALPTNLVTPGSAQSPVLAASATTDPSAAVASAVRTTVPDSVTPLPSVLETGGNRVSDPVTPHPLLSRPERRLSRRVILGGGLGLAGLALAGGGIGWWLSTQNSGGSQGQGGHGSQSHLGQLLYTYHGHSAYVTDVAWSLPDGTRIASASGDTTVQVWDAATGTRLLNFSGHGIDVYAVTWSPDGSQIASGSADKSVLVWDSHSRNISSAYKQHAGAVHTVAWSPDGKRIASGSADKTVQIWDATTGIHTFTYSLHKSSVNHVAWKPGGTRIASASADKTVRVWDATTGQTFLTYSDHTASVNSVAWSRDGTRIASASADKTVQIWDASTGNHISTYSGHTASVNAVAWSPDGTRIASASGDTTVQIWDASTGKHIFTYRGHSAYVSTLAWSLDGTRIASGGFDSSVQVWRAL